MKLEAINDPRAMQILNSLSMELGALETATVRIRARMDALFDLLAAVPVEAGEMRLAEADGEAAADEVGSIVVADAVSGDAASGDGENAEAPHSDIGPSVSGLSDSGLSDVGFSDSGVIVLCARIEASVAEFAAAADVASINSDAAVAREAPDGVSASAAEEHLDQAQFAAGEVSSGPIEMQTDVVADTDSVDAIEAIAAADEIIEPVKVEGEVRSEDVEAVDQAGDQPSVVAAESGGDAHSAPEGSELDAALLPTPAHSITAETEQEDAAAVVAEDASAASNVVPIKLKRRVWPQRLAACASVLLIAAAGVVVAMPELVWIHI